MRVLDVLELELQAVVSHPLWVLRTKLGSYAAPWVVFIMILLSIQLLSLSGDRGFVKRVDAIKTQALIFFLLFVFNNEMKGGSGFL